MPTSVAAWHCGKRLKKCGQDSATHPGGSGCGFWTSARMENIAMKPYAVCLLERFRGGEAATELASKEGIPLDRIQTRLNAAILLERIRKTETNPFLESRAA